MQTSYVSLTNSLPLTAAEMNPGYLSIPAAARPAPPPDNLVLLKGRLGTDPFLRLLSGDTHLTRLRLAVNNPRLYFARKAQGQKPQLVQWHTFTLFGSLARRAADQLRKGMLVAMEGQILVREYTGADGQKMVSTDIRITHFRIIEKESPAASVSPEE